MQWEKTPSGPGELREGHGSERKAGPPEQVALAILDDRVQRRPRGVADLSDHLAEAAYGLRVSGRRAGDSAPVEHSHDGPAAREPRNAR